MKRFFTIFFSFLCVALLISGSLWAAEDPIVLKVAKAGTLSELLKEHTDIENLTIEGELNATDFGALRQLSKVKSLSLEEVTIVVGGKYIAGPFDDEIQTVANVLPEKFLFDSPLTQSIESIVLPSSLEKLGARSLQNAEKITVLEFPETLVEIGEMALGYCSGLEKITIPEGVTKIGSSAFDHCSALVEIELSESLSELGSSAFNACIALKEIELPIGIKELKANVFKGCTALGQIQLPQMMVSIGDGAFRDCSSLSGQLELPYLLRSIGREVFKGCEMIEGITFNGANLKAIGDEVFFDCKSLEEVILPAGLEKIGGLAFNNCKSLKSIVLPAHLKIIMGGAFANTALTSVVLPESVQELNYGAFARCEQLEDVIMGANVRVFGEALFGGCSSLKWIDISAVEPYLFEKEDEAKWIENLKSMEDFVLYVPEGSKERYAKANGWENFKKIEEGKVLEATLSDKESLESILEKENPLAIVGVKLSGILTKGDMEAFSLLPRLRSIDLSEIQQQQGDAFETATIGCATVQKVILPQNLKVIPSSFFSGCFNLSEVEMPKEVTSIGEEAFFRCAALKNFVLPQTLTVLEESAFDGCSSLTEIVIPDGVEIIPDFAFNNCISVQKLVLGKAVSDIGKQAFFNCASVAEILFPEEVKEVKGYAFLGCSSLVRIACLGIAPAAVEETIFSEEVYKNIPLRIPTEEHKAAYQEAEVWSRFTSIVVDKSLVTVQEIEQPQVVRVYSDGENCVVYNESIGAVCFEIIDLSGFCLYKGSANEGVNKVALPNGFYVIKVDGKSYKIIIAR